MQVIDTRSVCTSYGAVMVVCEGSAMAFGRGE